jgi:hypothetical protein
VLFLFLFSIRTRCAAFVGSNLLERNSGAFKGCRQAPRSGAELHVASSSEAEEASGLEGHARSGMIPAKSKPPLLPIGEKGLHVKQPKS